jgi:hypothetical protein
MKTAFAWAGNLPRAKTLDAGSLQLNFLLHPRHPWFELLFSE